MSSYQQTKTSGTGMLATMAMLSLTLMGLGSNAITPALATLAAQFPNQDVSFIQTVATLSMMAGSLIAGAVMGKKIKTKTLAILGSILCLIFGILPVFMNSYALILVVRLVFGFTMGLIAPLGNALIMIYFQGNKRATLIGVGTFAMNIGGIAFQMLAGVLADISWNLAFLGHIFFAIAVIMSLFLPDEELEVVRNTDKKIQPKEKLNVRTVLLIGILMMVFQACNLSVMMNASTLYEVRNAGGATVAAIALTAFSVTGMFASLLFGVLFKHIKRAMFLMAFGCVAFGAGIIFMGQTAVIMGIGYGLIGIGFNWQFAAFTEWVGIATPPSTIGIGTSIILAFMNLGGFVSSFWMILLGYNLTKILLSDVILCSVFAIGLFIANPFKGGAQQSKMNCT